MSATHWVRAGISMALVVTASCERVIDRIGFERMQDQAKLEPYEATPLFADGRAMRTPPVGTVPRERVLDRPAFIQGTTADGEVVEIPMAIDRAALDRGRDRFERVCAACHGVLGHGNPAIVENASLRPPPSLHERRIRQQPPGRLFATVTSGYGLMPSYAATLSPADRWAVIAYLRVLWTSQAIALARLPPDLRAEALVALDAQEARR